MKINSIINSIQQEAEKEKEKDKLRPIMSYYIINNHIYQNNYNTNQNSKIYTKKKDNISISNFHNLNININTNTNSKRYLSKNNSILSAYNPLINNKIPLKHLKPKLSQENSPSIKDKILFNSRKDLNSGKNSKRHNKKIKLDSNFLIKKLTKPNKHKSTNDIFSNDNSFTINTEKRKKNKKTAITTLNSSKNSSKEKIIISSKKKLNLNHANYYTNNKTSKKGNDLNNNNTVNKITVTSSAKYISNSNNRLMKGKLTKKSSSKLINNKELFHPNNKNKGFDIFLNYIKGVKNIKAKNMISNNTSYKSITNIGNNNNISYNRPKISINISELKNEFINKEIKNQIPLKYPSIKINKYSKPNKSARALSFKAKSDKNKIRLNKLDDLNTKRLKKKIMNNKSKYDLNQYLEKNKLDSPYNKVFQKTSGNYFSPNNKEKNLNIKDKAMKTSYKNKFTKRKNLGINTVNNDKNQINKIENNKIMENVYTNKINKILKDGMKEINKIKNDFVKHFTTNNSPRKNNNKEKLKEKRKIISKLNISKNYDSNNILSKPHKKLLKKNLTGISNLKMKALITKKNNESQTQRVNQLTQNNSKQNFKKINIPKINTKIIDLKKNLSIKNTPSLIDSSRSTVHDSFYYLKESQKLSEYIKQYYKKNKKYPETNLNFYKYGRLIGQGAFGKVNLGLNILTGRVVAIKSFNKTDLNSNSENMKKILYETNLMKKLNHPNITKILELFEDKEYILIIMEYINGGNLFNFLKKHRKVSEKTAKLLYKQIILGIKYMHEQNIVHRDIKLENILIDLNNNIKICDFGIGRVLSSPEQSLFDQCGTPMYIAPEILLCSKEKGYKGFPVDIWSSGIVLYILLSGSLPFSFENSSLNSSKESRIEEDNNSLDLQYSIINNEPKEIENISKEGKDLLNKLLEKNPEKRITLEEILEHPWMKDIISKNIDSNKYHLFTKAEINILSKTYVDYRKDKNDNLKETFTLSNLFSEEKGSSDKNRNKNEETKSSILAPFNSVIKSNEEEDSFYDEGIMDDFNNNRIKLENDIIKVGNKVKEFNMLYEINNNCEVDNGIIINSNSNTLSSKSNSNSIIINNEIKDNNGFIMIEFNERKNKNKIKDMKSNRKNLKDKEKILTQMELLGYDKKYVKECVKNNVLCHASAAYFLMLNYDNI